jgi:uncharacterized protein YndB with AHSA1/START domain
MTKAKIKLERTYKATLKDIWDLWTTKEGIESWWGPDGFSVKVLKLELHPGGELRYAMTATAPPQVEFMKKAGMPPTTETKVQYTEVVANERLAYTTKADFIPNVEPYDTATVIEFYQNKGEVRMVLSFDPMHDDVWTKRATMGHEGQLGKLGKLLEAR